MACCTNFKQRIKREFSFVFFVLALIWTSAAIGLLWPTVEIKKKAGVLTLFTQENHSKLLSTGTREI